MNFNSICTSSENTILASNTATNHQHQKSLHHAQLPQKSRDFRRETLEDCILYTFSFLPSEDINTISCSHISVEVAPVFLRSGRLEWRDGEHGS